MCVERHCGCGCGRGRGRGCVDWCGAVGVLGGGNIASDQNS